MSNDPGTATPKQLSFIRKLADERNEPINEAEMPNLSKQAASDYITLLLELPKPKQQQLTRKSEPTVTDPGVYETPEGTVYVVKPNRAKTNLYAKRLVEINAERALAAGGRVEIEFEYERGAIFKLEPSMKMDLERAKALTIRYGKCIVCGRGLKAAESVERGIGPVCIKSFRPSPAPAAEPVDPSQPDAKSVAPYVWQSEADLAERESYRAAGEAARVRASVAAHAAQIDAEQRDADRRADGEATRKRIARVDANREAMRRRAWGVA